MFSRRLATALTAGAVVGLLIRPPKKSITCGDTAYMTVGSTEGIVTRFDGKVCRVLVDDATLDCAVRGVLFKDLGDCTHPVCAGDRVRIESEGGAHAVAEVLPRTTLIARPIPGRALKIKPIAANIDQLVIIAAMRKPRLRLGLVDRLIVCAERAGVRAIVVLNKIDLCEPEDVATAAYCYTSCGYRVLTTCGLDARGIDELRAVLVGTSSMLVGPSGVGKSTLLNLVEPGLELKTGPVSDKTTKGMHVTTTVTLIPLAAGGYVADTPGVREFGLYDLTAEEVAGYFREFEPFAGECRFSNCSHTHEPGCAVKGAVETGRINRQRYAGYVRLRESLE